MNSPLVEIYKRHGSPSKVLQLWDIDFTLRNTMCTNTLPDEQALFEELYDRSEGGCILISGRHIQAIDETIAGEYPASGEQHSAMRLHKGGDIISLGTPLNSEVHAERLRHILNGDIMIANDPASIRDGQGPGVYIEPKAHSIALVHRIHDDVEYDRDILRAAANQLIDTANLSATHHRVEGSDAIEIVPKGLAYDHSASIILPHTEILRMESEGLDKVTGLHNFMHFHPNRTPYSIGDSGTDGAVMNEAFRIYGGGGIWVDNKEEGVPAKFADAVEGRVIKNYTTTWNHIREALAYLRETIPGVYESAEIPRANAEPQHDLPLLQ